MRTRSLLRAAVAMTGAAAYAGFALTPNGVAAPVFSAPVVVDDAGNGGEPFVNSDSDGNLFIDFPTGTPGRSELYKSADGGATWQRLTSKLPLPGGGDSHTVFGEATGTAPDPIYFTDLWVGSASVQRSTDGGRTWLGNVVSTVPVDDRQWLAAVGPSTVYHAYTQIGSGTWVGKSVDGGLNFVPVLAAPTLTARTGCICPPGNMVAWGENVLLVYYTSTQSIAVAQSTNGGLTYTQRTIVSRGTSNDVGFAFPIITRAPDTGRIVAAWSERVGSAYRISTSYSDNNGTTWSTPQVAVSGATAIYPWVDAGTGGKVSLVYYQTDGWSGVPDSAPAGTNWHIRYAESANGGATFGAGVTVDPFRVKTGRICTDGLNCSGDRQLLEYPSVTVTPSNQAKVTYTRVKSGNDTVVLFSGQTG